MGRHFLRFLLGCGAISFLVRCNEDAAVEPVLALVAGALGGQGNTDGVGSAARFNFPRGVATVGTNLFVVDTENHTIRKVVIATGGVTTLAGLPGTFGTADGTGTAARFNFPRGLATDSTNLFVGDSGNHTIRKVVIATGVVTTLAGLAGTSGTADGTGTAARFNSPRDVAVDSTNLFVADTDNHTIRKVVIATGAVTTLAGLAGTFGTTDGTGTAARFNFPRGLATDGTNLFVVDTDNHTIRKVVISTGAVTTFAGQAGTPGSTDAIGTAASFNSPRGVATDLTHLFVADAGNQTIRKVVIATGVVTTLAGLAEEPGAKDGTGTAARFDNPRGVATDGTNLFVADTLNQTIRKVVIASGVVTTLAGQAWMVGTADGIGSAARFNFPMGFATDGTNLFVADTFNHIIRKVTLSNAAVITLVGFPLTPGTTDGAGLGTRFRNPRGITTDGTNLFVADTDNNTIRKVVIASGVVTTLAGLAAILGFTDGIGSAARFNNPRGLVTDGTSLFVSDTNNHTIRKITLSDAAVITLVGFPNTSGTADGAGLGARFNLPEGLVTDGTNLYVADAQNHAIRKVVIASGVVTTLAGLAGTSGTADGTGTAARFYFPRGLATDGTNLYVADSGNHTIRKIVLASGVVSTPIGIAGTARVDLGSLPGRLSDPRAIAVASGKLLIAASAENSILTSPAP